MSAASKPWKSQADKILTKIMNDNRGKAFVHSKDKSRALSDIKKDLDSSKLATLEGFIQQVRDVFLHALQTHVDGTRETQKIRLSVISLLDVFINELKSAKLEEPRRGMGMEQLGACRSVVENILSAVVSVCVCVSGFHHIRFGLPMLPNLVPFGIVVRLSRTNLSIYLAFGSRSSISY
jgi:hypothetical protein